MKSMLIFACLTLGLLMGCTTTVDELSPTQSAIATVAIQTGTVELINKDSDRAKETASNIIDVATEALLLVDSGSVTVVDELDFRMRERISELNLSPEKKLVADMLIILVKAEIENRIGDKVLDPETVVTIATVLKIMVDTAERYQ